MESNDLALWQTMGGDSLVRTPFASPWSDMAMRYTPRTIKDALTLSEFLWINYGVYRSASCRVVDYFLTKAVFKGQDDDERKKFETIMSKDFGVIEKLREIGYDMTCFSGDTKTTTEDGIFSLRELSGKTVNVLSRDGVYRPAEFRSFGFQSLMEVCLSDGQKFLVTPEHQWEVKNCSGKKVRVSTIQLCKGYRIERTVAPRPERNAEYEEGIRHGFVFGDGSRTNSNRPKIFSTHARFFGNKDRDIMKYFEGHGGKPVPDKKRDFTYIFGLPANYKDLPDNNKSASYWYGFVSGFMAADGNVTRRDGCPTLAQVTRSTLEIIADQLPRIGMCSGPVRDQIRDVEILGRYYENHQIFILSLLRRFMQPEDFLIADHRASFENNHDSDSKYGIYVGIESVQNTGLVSEVFCCVEPETHTFVVGNGILTGNCYGNSFSSIHLPFKRVLRCARCSDEHAIDDTKRPFKFDTSDFSFHRHCPKCKEITQHMVQDYRNVDSKKIRLVRWDPKQITIEPNEITGENRYWLNIPSRIASKVRQGDPYILSTIPWTFIAAIKKQQKYRFKPEAIYHLREASLAGLFLSGWGIPSILSAFKNFFRLQVMLRYDETLMMDYIVPLRILCPETLSIPMGNDFVTVNMQNFIQDAEGAIRKHRIDGCDWTFFPYQVKYQAVGGEGQQLSMSTKDVIAQEEDRLLQIRGVPSELYRGTLSLQSAPVALRLFERTHSPLVSGFNNLLQWMGSTVARYLDHGTIEAELQPVTIADNVEDKQWRIQAAMAGAISKATGLGALAIDPKEENKLINQEQLDAQQQSQKAQQDAQMASMSLGDQQQGSSFQGGQQGGGMTPTDVEAQGDEMARQLLDPQMPEANRRQQLSSLRETNPTLHAVVLKKMEQLRNQAGTAGRSAGLQQMGIAKGGEFFGKTASFSSMRKQAQVMWMAHAYFPCTATRRHSLTFEPTTQKTALNIWYHHRSWPVYVDDQDMDSDPLVLMGNIASQLIYSDSAQ